MHQCLKHLFQSACSTHCRPCTYAPMHIRVHMHAHAHGCVRAPKTPSDTPRRRHQDPPSAHTCAYACACIRVRMYAYTGARALCMNMHTCTPAHMYAYTSTHTRMWMYACTHASTPGMIAPQQHGEELIQTPEASHISPFQRNQPHSASQCWDFIVPTS